MSTFLVKIDHRRKCYRKQIGDAALKSLDKNVTIGMDAVTDMVPRYESYGFRSVWNTLVVELDLSKIVSGFAEVSIPSGIWIKPINAIDMAKLIKYDASVYGVSRERFTQAWVTIPDSRGWVAVDESGNVIGYAAVRPVISSPKMNVGLLNLYADNEVITKLLLKAMVDSYVTDETIQETEIEMLCCDGGEYGHHGLQLVAGIEAKPSVVIGPRMYTKGIPPERQLQKIYGTTSPAYD